MRVDAGCEDGASWRVGQVDASECGGASHESSRAEQEGEQRCCRARSRRRRVGSSPWSLTSTSLVRSVRRGSVLDTLLLAGLHPPPSPSARPRPAPSSHAHLARSHGPSCDATRVATLATSLPPRRQSQQDRRTSKQPARLSALPCLLRRSPLARFLLLSLLSLGKRSGSLSTWPEQPRKRGSSDGRTHLGQLVLLVFLGSRSGRTTRFEAGTTRHIQADTEKYYS